MTTDRRFSDRNRDIQDGTEVHVYSKKEYVKDGGSVVRVKGTGTTDDEVIVANSGYGFNLPEDSNAEVLVMADGSDMTRKIGFMQIPHDKQREWPEGTGGTQHPTDPSRFIEFNGDETHLSDGVFILGKEKGVKVTVSGGEITMEFTKLTLKGNVEIEGEYIKHNGTRIDDTHKHGGIEPGGGITDEPVE